ncbi:hypothetical protein MKX01_024165 [Papaver californicum]|nr:hypothetical protein MKX01_024165 [Papaver californicum]
MKTSSKGASSASAAIDRKTIEKNRRIHMKALCFKLVPLIPPTDTDHQNHSSKKVYIYFLFLSLSHTHTQKNRYLAKSKIGSYLHIITSNAVVAATSTKTGDNLLNLPIRQVRDFDSNTSEVVLVTGLNKHFMYYQVITVLEEEGDEVVNASFATVRAGVETPRICDVLKKLVS